MLCASHLHLAMNTKCCVPLTCTLLSLCLAFNIVWMWLLLYLVMGSFPLQGLGLWGIETKKIDLRKTMLCWNCETLHWQRVEGPTATMAQPIQMTDDQLQTLIAALQQPRHRWMEAPKWQQEQLLWLARCLPAIWARTRSSVSRSGRTGSVMQRTRWPFWKWTRISRK